MKINAILASLLLMLGNTVAYGAIDFVRGELFLEVWDPVGKTSYTFDLGIGPLRDFKNNPSAHYGYSTSISFPGATPASNWLWTVKASGDDSYTSIQIDNDPEAPSNFTGFLSTVRDAAEATQANYGPYDGVRSVISNHVADINGPDLNNSLHVNKVFRVADQAYYLGPGENGIYGSTLGDAVQFRADAPIGASMPMYFFTVSATDFVTGVIANNGAPLGVWTFDGATLGFTQKVQGAPCSLPASLGGGSLNDGEQIKAYKEGTNDFCEVPGNWETRICNNGTLSGSFTFASCKREEKPDCTTPWGETVKHGATVTGYSTGESNNCEAARKTLTCDAGNLPESDVYKFPSCKPVGACTLPWGGVLGNGQSIPAYSASLSDNCESAKKTLTCTAGNLPESDVYKFQSCSKPLDCTTEWGAPVPHGSSIAGYSASLSTNCESARKTLTCSNGNLPEKAVYKFATCGVPQNCTTPWGEAAAHGQAVTAYSSDLSANCNAAAVKQTRSCDNGTLAFDDGFRFAACRAPLACDLPWTGKLGHGESVPAYQVELSPNCEAAKQVRACNDGVLSGDNGYAKQLCRDILQIRMPNGGETWRMGTRYLVGWRTNGLTAKQRLKLYFSKDGGQKFQLLKGGLKGNSSLVWRPARKHVTENGAMKICLPKTRTTPEICDTSDSAFAILRK